MRFCERFSSHIPVSGKVSERKEEVEEDEEEEEEKKLHVRG